MYCKKTYPVKPAAIILFIIILTSLSSNAQQNRAIRGEEASCTIKVSQNKGTDKNERVSDKNYIVFPNQLGYFDRVSNIQPKQKVPIEIAYPQSNEGEKVVIIVADGGTLDNGKKVKVAQLINQKLFFTFQVASDLGIYRAFLKKGSDTKVVQLWVGAEPTVVKQ